MTTPETSTDQAPVQSMEDRIAAQFGLEDDQPAPEAVEETPEEEATEEAAPESDEVEVEWGEARYRVPKALEEAFSKARDYTQKTQTLAEQRRQVEYTQKALEAARLEREFNESVSEDLANLKALDGYLKHLESVDLRQLSTDDKLTHFAEMQARERQRKSLHESIQARKDEYSGKAKQAVQALKAQARELLGKQGVTEEALSELGKYAQTQGYTEQDIEMIQLDPRATSMLHKARLYDQLQASKADAVQKAKTAPPAIKPGAVKPMPDAVKQKLALRKAFHSAPNKAERDAIMQKRVEQLFG